MKRAIPSISKGTSSKRRGKTIEGATISGEELNRSKKKSRQKKSKAITVTQIPSHIKQHFMKPMSSYTIATVCEHILLLLRMLESQEGIKLPIVLSAAAIEATMTVPRRRIYDVLHILGAIGLVNYIATGSLKGYWYHGEAPVMKTLSELKESALVSTEAMRNCIAPFAPLNLDKSTSTGQHLVRSTIKVLKFLFAIGQPVCQSDLHLLHDKQPGLNTGNGRRTYDVTAVLIQCNIVENYTSEGGTKCIRLNRTLFTPAFTIFSGIGLENEEKKPQQKKQKPLSDITEQGCRVNEATPLPCRVSEADDLSWCQNFTTLPDFLTLPASKSVLSATDEAMALIDQDIKYSLPLHIWDAVEASDPLFPLPCTNETLEELDPNSILELHDWLDT